MPSSAIRRAARRRCAGACDLRDLAGFHGRIGGRVPLRAAGRSARPRPSSAGPESAALRSSRRCTSTSSVSAAPSWAGSRDRPCGRPRVTGCDAEVYPPMSTQLEAQGIEIVDGLSARADRARARPLGDRQCRDARQPVDGGDARRGRAASSPDRSGSPKPCSHDKYVLAVSGTHGKTTTASMLASILERAGNHPGSSSAACPTTSACRRGCPPRPSSSSSW